VKFELCNAHEFVNALNAFLKNDQENITKTQIDEKETFTKFTNSKKCFKRFAKKFAKIFL
jgi:hypothetical protein